MNFHRTRAAHRVVGALAVATLLASAGCAKAGGDTTCEDYLKMSQSDQAEQVSKLYKDKHGHEPSGIEATGVQQEATVYCQTAGNAKSKIKEIPLS